MSALLPRLRLEHTECDFKREVERTKTKNWLKSVCAFANGIGGMLIFGIDDKTREHVPLKDIQSDIEFITSCIKDRISPIPDFILAPDFTENGGEVLVLKVRGGLNTPYYLTENSNRITFIRAGSSTVQADTPILHELILKGTNRTWDTLKSEYMAKDFSFTFLESMYYNKTGSRISESDFHSFGIITKDGFLTNTGTLFADFCPLRHSRIFCTRWNGLSKAPSNIDALDDKEYSGNILQLLGEGEGFIKLHNQKIWYKTANSRVEKENFPERAIHEIMVNALVHRDYGVLGSEIHIDIFDDRVEIQNPGGMYDGIPVQFQNLENIVSTRRNPVIADIMSRMNLMERRGSGFRKIMDAVKFAPDFKVETLPSFHSTAYTFTAEIKNMNYIKADGGLSGGINGGLSGSINDSINDSIKLSDTELRILSEISKQTSITILELMKITGLSESTVNRALKTLQNKKRIARVGAKKNGHWEIIEKI